MESISTKYIFRLKTIYMNEFLNMCAKMNWSITSIYANVLKPLTCATFDLFICQLTDRSSAFLGHCGVINMPVYASLRNWFLSPLDVYPEVGLLDNIIVLFSFSEAYTPFPMVAVLICISVKSMQGLFSLHTLTSTCYVWSFFFFLQLPL